MFMSEIASQVGARLRAYRQQSRLSQEALAELAGVHPTYIGQLERGEKNASLETIEKVCRALQLPMAKLFDKLDQASDCATQCYELVLQQPPADQRRLLSMLEQLIAYRKLTALCMRHRGGIFALPRNNRIGRFIRKTRRFSERNVSNPSQSDDRSVASFEATFHADDVCISHAKHISLGRRPNFTAQRASPCSGAVRRPPAAGRSGARRPPLRSSRR